MWFNSREVDLERLLEDVLEVVSTTSNVSWLSEIIQQLCKDQTKQNQCRTLVENLINILSECENIKNLEIIMLLLKNVAE